jgi:hypothetical protein
MGVRFTACVASMVLAWVAGCGGVESSAPPSDGAADVTCEQGGHVSPRGHCVYPAPPGVDCTTSLVFASGQCVPAEWAPACGCAENPCALVFCADGECGSSPLADSQGCSVDGGPEGICWRGECCFGCWDGTTCRSGTEVDACGNSVTQMCHSCGDSCNVGTCSSGFCSSAPINGPGCPPCGGVGEACCAGSSCGPTLACEARLVAEDYGPSLCYATDGGNAADASGEAGP